MYMYMCTCMIIILLTYCDRQCIANAWISNWFKLTLSSVTFSLSRGTEITNTKADEHW